MGSGKSYWGRLLSERLQMPYADLDTAIEKDTGKTVALLFEEQGEETFRKREREMLESLINSSPTLVLSAGGGTPCFFNNIELMKRSGTVVWLNPPIEVLCERLASEMEQRPLLRQVPLNELRSFILKKMNDRRLYYEQAQVHINEAAPDLESLIQQILHE